MKSKFEILEDVLWKRSHVRIPVGSNEESFTVRCPFHKDRKPSMYINLNTNFWICYAYPDECGKGMISELLAKLLDVPVFKAEKMLRAQDPLSEEIEFTTALEKHYKSEDYDDYSVKGYVDLPTIEIDYDNKKVPSWIFNRGFTKESMIHWNCGLKDDSLLIPIEDECYRCVGWIKRQPDGKMPKYLYQEGFAKSLTLFGLGEFYKNWYGKSKYIIITEGPLDTMWFAQHGYPAVAIMGVSLSYFQERLLRNTGVPEFVLCLDNDEAGQKGTVKVKERLERAGLVTLTYLPDWAKDIQDIKDPQIIDNVIKNRTLIW